MKIPCCARDLNALGETIPASAREADLSMTVSASSSDCATTAIRQLRPSISVRKKETPWSAGGPSPSLAARRGLPARGDQDRIHFIHGLLHLHHVVGTSKPEGVDLKPSWPAVPALPIKRLRGDEETRSFQVDFRVWMLDN